VHVNVTRHVDSTQVEIEQALMLNFFNRAFPSDEISQKSAAQSFCVAKCVVSWLLRKSTIANQVQSERAAFMSVALEWEILKKRTHKLGEERPLSIQRANSRVFPSNEKSWKKSAHHRIS